MLAYQKKKDILIYISYERKNCLCSIVSVSDNFQIAFNSLSKEKNNLLNKKSWQKDLKENNVEFDEGEDYAFYDKMCEDERFSLTIEEKILNK